VGTYPPISSNLELGFIGIFTTLVAISFWRLGQYISDQNSLGPDWAKWAVKWPLLVIAIGLGLQGYIAIKDVFLGCKNQFRNEESEPVSDLQRIYVRAKTKCELIAERSFANTYWLIVSVFTGFFVAMPFLLKELMGIRIPSYSSDMPWKFESQEQVSIFFIVCCTLFQLMHFYKNLTSGTTYSPTGMNSPFEHLHDLFLPALRQPAGLVQITKVSEEEENQVYQPLRI